MPLSLRVLFVITSITCVVSLIMYISGYFRETAKNIFYMTSGAILGGLCPVFILEIRNTEDKKKYEREIMDIRIDEINKESLRLKINGENIIQNCVKNAEEILKFTRYVRENLDEEYVWTDRYYDAKRAAYIESKVLRESCVCAIKMLEEVYLTFKYAVKQYNTKNKDENDKVILDYTVKMWGYIVKILKEFKEKVIDVDITGVDFVMEEHIEDIKKVKNIVIVEKDINCVDLCGEHDMEKCKNKIDCAELNDFVDRVGLVSLITNNIVESISSGNELGNIEDIIKSSIVEEMTKYEQKFDSSILTDEKINNIKKNLVGEPKQV